MIEITTMTALQDATVEEILKRFSDLENYSEEVLAPY
jgi:hypothetical protein